MKLVDVKVRMSADDGFFEVNTEPLCTVGLLIKEQLPWLLIVRGDRSSWHLAKVKG